MSVGSSFLKIGVMSAHFNSSGKIQPLIELFMQSVSEFIQEVEASLRICVGISPLTLFLFFNNDICTLFFKCTYFITRFKTLKLFCGKNSRISKIIYENLWQSIKFYKNLWTSIRINENMYKSVQISINQIEIYENIRNILEKHGKWK